MTKSLTALCLLASGSVSLTKAFSTQASVESKLSSTSSTKLYASSDRREFLASGLVAAGVSLWSGAANAANEVDFDKVQDLLGQSYQPTGSAQLYEQRTTKRPTFLTDPTEEFKQNEQKAADFKRAQLKAKNEFQTALDKLQTDPNDGERLAKDLDEIRYLVQKNAGLPEGISKKEVITQVRRRKAKKFWPTEVEIAYQDLLLEIQKMQSPNTDRDTGDFV